MILSLQPSSEREKFSLIGEDRDMARRRGQRKGNLRAKGPSWIFRWWEYDRDGTRHRRAEAIADTTGPNAKSKREAQRIAWDTILSKLDSRALRPSSTMTVEAFVQTKFTPQHVETLKPGGKRHYRSMIDKHILPGMGGRRLCDIAPDDVEMLIAKRRAAGLGNQSLLHIKNAISAVFRHAKRLRLYTEENPAWGVEVGEIRPTRIPTLDWEQAELAIKRLPSPYREMALTSVVTSMGVTELAGLRRRWCNLSGQPVQVDGEFLPRFTVAVRENFYQWQYGSVKTGKRNRNIGIPPELADKLKSMIAASAFQGEDYPVFCSRRGTPIDAHNVSNKVFRPLSTKLGFAVTWRAFRRAHSTFMGLLDVPLEDRMATMGHGDARMTLRYSVADVERRRKPGEEIMRRVMGRETRVVPIKRKAAGA